MRLSQLIDGLDARVIHGRNDVNILEVVEDSRLATPGCVFVARKGTKSDGMAFARAAVEAGAVAVVVQGNSELDLPAQVTQVAVPNGLEAAALLAGRLSGHPDRDLQLIGVTGTNGKTTITYLVRHLFAAAGQRCGLVGTVDIDDGQRLQPAAMTTPPSVEVCRLLRRMVDNGCHASVMEVSSHALSQNRVSGLTFRAGVFTNLTGDHLDYHGSMDAYADAKAGLFEMLPEQGTAVVNADDAAAQRMIRKCVARVLRCSMRDRSADCFAEVSRSDVRGSDVLFAGPWGKIECTVPLIGHHNVMNCLQAAAAVWACGVGRRALDDGLRSAPAPPGRLQPVEDPSGRLTVLVDYAHTDDALENVLRAVRDIVPSGAHLWTVFGCGGDRDRTKRPRMARVACAGSNRVVITSDNPRTEEPRAIIAEIETGVPPSDRVNVLVETDRAKAIALAISSASDHDVIVIAGKGHEDYQIIGTTKHDFDDRTIAAAAISRRNETAVIT